MDLKFRKEKFVPNKTFQFEGENSKETCFVWEMKPQLLWAPNASC